MSNRSETFGRLLKGAINSIAAYEGKTAPVIEDELGDQIGVAGSTIQRYKAGYLPTEPRVVQILAEAAVRRGFLSRAWLTRFLQAVRYPNPDVLITQLADSFGQAVASSDERTLPAGTLTFLFTDIEGSTTRWEHQPQAMERALARHDELLRQAIDAYGGQVLKTVGDAFQAVFTTAPTALEAALAAQRALANESWGPIEPIRVRMGIHVGSVQIRDDDYFGQPLNRVARLCAAGHGGQVLLSNAAQELVRDALPTGTALRDLGEHRLKDLARPERIFQVTAADLQSDFPPLRSLDRYTHNLPAQPTALIGREAEALAVCDLLRRDNVRLLTLTGPGGTGKTRLALQAAADLLDAFHAGVWFVALAPIRDHTLVLAAIAQALGVVEAPGQALEDSLKAYLRSRQTLLVLDNCEQVLAAAPLIAALLAAAPALKVLATSREVLHLYGEHEYEVPPLSLPDLQHLPPIERLTQYEAVRLFIERAQAVRSDFIVTGENAPAIAEICVRLDGLPLAIELAAARSKLFPPRALLARLDKRLALLTGGPRDLPARQQTLRNAIGWSYDLLDPAEQAIFARLGVFAGGCTLKAAEAVLADDQAGNAGDLTAYIPASAVLDGLASLVDKSLLKEVESGEDTARFVMLETIQEYALERLVASSDEDTIRRRHAHYFMELAEAAEPHLDARGQRAWIQRLEVEHDNLRSALAWAIEHASALGLRLAGALGWFWANHGYHREGRDWLLQTLNRATDSVGADVDRLRAKALNQAGYLAIWLRDLPQATALLEQSVALWRALGEPRGLAHALCDWGVALYNQGNGANARALLETSIAAFRQVGEKQGLVVALFWHGNMTSLQGDFPTARASAEESIRLGRDVGDVSNIAASTSVLSYIAFCQGEYPAAHSLAAEALQLYREVGEKMGIALLLGVVGPLAYLQGQYGQAKLDLEEQLQLWRALGRQHDIAWSLSALGYVALRQNDRRRAAALFAESLALFRELNARPSIAICLAGVAEVAEAAGQLDRAAQLQGATQALLAASGRRLEDTEQDLASPCPITSQAEFERHVATVRAALGEAAFAAAWAKGQAMLLEQAIAEALAVANQPPE